MRLKDKVILVTASTRGIGLAIVKKCSNEGAQVYMAARDLDRAQEIAKTLPGTKCVYNDATKPETFTAMVEDVVRDAGRIDVLVNNFGTPIPERIWILQIPILKSFWTLSLSISEAFLWPARLQQSTWLRTAAVLSIFPLWVVLCRMFLK